MSAVIIKSWPTRERGEFVDDLGGVLKHLLTWPDIKHLFKLYGMFMEGAGSICPVAPPDSRVVAECFTC